VTCTIDNQGRRRRHGDRERWEMPESVYRIGDLIKHASLVDPKQKLKRDAGDRTIPDVGRA
jgi:hypothetical protein